MGLLGGYDFCGFLHGRLVLFYARDLWAVYLAAEGKDPLPPV
jgi:hypothetical protein